MSTASGLFIIVFVLLVIQQESAGRLRGFGREVAVRPASSAVDGEFRCGAPWLRSARVSYNDAFSLR